VAQSRAFILFWHAPSVASVAARKFENWLLKFYDNATSLSLSISSLSPPSMQATSGVPSLDCQPHACELHGTVVQIASRRAEGAVSVLHLLVLGRHKGRAVKVRR
jgi:hypothetical protein